MADPLYQLLALHDTVGAEHTEVQNIIQRYAGNTDGYAALYEIMERIHPLLNPDAKLQAPLSINCTFMTIPTSFNLIFFTIVLSMCTILRDAK